jgi:hypothetical protein
MIVVRFTAAASATANYPGCGVRIYDLIERNIAVSEQIKVGLVVVVQVDASYVRGITVGNRVELHHNAIGCADAHSPVVSLIWGAIKSAG